MKISVIVPYKNAAEYLPRCIESLKSQKGDFEFVFVNDNEPEDKSERAIANRLTAGDDRFINVSNGNRPGVSGARNEGLMVATGDWITFLDADDEMLPGAWEIYENMIKSGMSKVYQASHIRALKSGARNISTDHGGTFMIPRVPNMWAAVWNKLYDADVLRSWGLRFDESLQYGEDVIFNLDVLNVYRQIVAYEACTVRHYMTNPESLSMVRTEHDLHKLIHALLQKLEMSEMPDYKLVIYNQIMSFLTTPWFSNVMQGKREQNGD